MLNFGVNKIEWIDIAEVSITNQDTNEVAVTTADNLTLVVGTYLTAAQADTVKAMIEGNKAAASMGGILIDVQIDDF